MDFEKYTERSRGFLQAAQNMALARGHQRFAPEVLARLVTESSIVSAQRDRMAMVLDGPRLPAIEGHDIVSDGTVPGAIQVPGSGQPIVLMAEAQTTGGYPKIATVIAADLPALGRLAPGARVAFEAVDIAAAEAEHRRLAARLAALPRQVVALRGASVWA